MNNTKRKVGNKEVVTQHLSAIVRGRLLFKKEIEIDKGSKNKFDESYFQRLINVKSRIDHDMNKSLVFSVTLTFLLYLAGVGVAPEVPLWDINISEVPGVLYFLALSGSYTFSIAVFLFMNSQTYAALIDQVLLEQCDDGIIDPDLLKASYEKEWLIFKLLRKNFSFDVPAHINMSGVGLFLNRAIFFLIVIISMSPFLVLIFVQPYLSFYLLPSDWFGHLTRIFSLLCATTALAVVFVANANFRCEIDFSGTAEDMEE